MNKVELLKKEVSVYGIKRTLVVVGILYNEIEDPDDFFNYPENVKTAPGWILNSRLIDSEEDYKAAEEFAEHVRNAKIEFSPNGYNYDWLIDSVNITDSTDYMQYTWVENDRKPLSLQETVDAMEKAGCYFYDDNL